VGSRQGCLAGGRDSCLAIEKRLQDKTQTQNQNETKKAPVCGSASVIFPLKLSSTYSSQTSHLRITKMKNKINNKNEKNEK
jgi:hypothetical protein